MNNRKLFLAILVLFVINLSCNQPVTPSIATPTEYFPPTIVAVDHTSTPYIPPEITPSMTEYVPPPVPPTPRTPTLFIPPTITPTLFIPIPPPPLILTYIEIKYSSLGGKNGFLGQALGTEQFASDGKGRFRNFQGGVIYWTTSAGAYEVHGAILAKWSELGLERSILGYPITDESITPDGIGRYNHFQSGSIYWTPNTGAYEIHGVIRERWSQLGWERSCLGYPVSDEEPSSGNWTRQSRFERGIIQWSPSQGALETCY